MMMDKLDQLREALNGHSQLLIIPHNDSDPDAVASAVALRYLLSEIIGVESQIRHRGIIGRAENKALVRYLKHPLKRLHLRDFNQDMPVALVDTQPGAGNNPLPKESRPGSLSTTMPGEIHHRWCIFRMFDQK